MGESLLNQTKNTIRTTIKMREESVLKQKQLMVLTRQLKVSMKALNTNVSNMEFGSDTKDLVVGMIQKTVDEYDAAMNAYRQEYDNLIVLCGVLERSYQSMAMIQQNDSPEPTPSMMGSLALKQRQQKQQQQQDVVSPQNNEGLMKQVRGEDSKLIFDEKYLNLDLQTVLEEVSGSYKSMSSTLSKDDGLGDLNELRKDVRNHDQSIPIFKRKVETIQEAQRLQVQAARRDDTDSNVTTAGANVSFTFNTPNQELDDQIQIILKRQQDMEHRMNDFTALLRNSPGSIEKYIEKNVVPLTKQLKAALEKNKSWLFDVCCILFGVFYVMFIFVFLEEEKQGK